MGNQPSKAPQPTSSPSTAANDQHPPPRRAAKRKDSPHLSPLPAKTTTSTATAALEHVAAKASQHAESRASTSSSRGRAQTVEGKIKEKAGRISAEATPVARAATTPNRSLSPYRQGAKAPPPITTNFVPGSTVASPRDAASPSPVPTPYYLPPANYIHPPRLPLPLEDDLLSPGSPIISPADIGTAVDRHDVESTMPRRSSVLSSTTMDEDDVGDEIYRPLDQGPGMPAVDTLIEWKQGGTKVYVTGTFANYWNKKYKLHEKYVNYNSLIKLNWIMRLLLPTVHYLNKLIRDHADVVTHGLQARGAQSPSTRLSLHIYMLHY